MATAPKTRPQRRLTQAELDAFLEFGNVVRTWLRLSDIMTWYGEFNKVRNQKTW